MKPLTITLVDGMVSVRSDDFDYSQVPDMYKGGRPGDGIQVNSGIPPLTALAMCRSIAMAVSMHGVKLQANSEDTRKEAEK